MTTTPTTTALVTFRRLAGCALIALAAQSAFAQSAPSDPTDPPGRVARVNYMAGTVTTEPAGASDWSYASLNRPLTTGDQLWNDTNARTELHIGSTAVRLGPSTSLDVLNLDDSTAQLKVAQGTLSTRVRDLPPNTSYEIDTPNAALSVTQPGDYRVDVAPDGSTTTVTVRSGALTAYGDSGQVPISAGEQVTFTGTNLQAASSGAVPPPDEFDQWAASRDAAEDRSVSARYVSRDVPGYQDLDANGTWSDNPQYGEVWVPNSEPAGWAPYHDGHWAWVAPWGWTWVDDAPWGFAPYHYGRWAYVGSTWAWVPGPIVSAPVYAPALVAFVGDGGGGFNLSINLSIGGRSDPGVAWFPLGPGDVWHPGWGGWSNRYYERVNQTVIINHNVNITNIHNTYINYHAPGALTAVPANAFVHGQPIAHYAQKVDPRQWHNAQINSGAPNVAPVRQSLAPGMRPANYRPPQALTNRPVVATRQPAMPAAFHDPLAQHLAQSGAKIPGAGQPFTGMTPPAGAQRGYESAGAPRSVHVVAQNSPVVSPRPAPAAGRVEPNGPRGVAGEPNMPNVPHAPVAGTHTSPSGVPHPPVMGNTNMAPSASQHQPSWTQPHAPISQQRAPSAQSHVPPNTANQWHEATRPAQPSPQVPARTSYAPHAMPSEQPQPAYRQPSMPVPQPRPEQYEPRPQQQVMQPHPQPQMQPRPQPQMQPRPQPQPQPRPEPPHVQPMPQPHPQVQAMQPHPQMQAMQSHPAEKPASHTTGEHEHQ